MAESTLITTTLVIPSPSAEALINLNEFFRPGVVGNGRVWVSGSIENNSAINAMEYQVNDRDWIRVTGPLSAFDKFGFYITGDAPSDWGTQSITEFTQEIDGAWALGVIGAVPIDDYFVTTQVREIPVYVVDGSGNYYVKVGSVAEMGLFDRAWFWDELTNTFYFRTADGLPPPAPLNVIIDPIFEQGNEYTVRIRVQATDNSYSLLMEQVFDWPYQVRNYVDRYIRNLLPTYAQDDPYLRKIYTVYAKQMADSYASLDDCIAQFLIDFTTWGLPLWEKQLGIPSIPSLSIDTRRSLLKARSNPDSTRAGFFDAITSIAPGVVITESYEQYRIDVRIVGVVDVALRRALEEIIEQRKPAGIRVVVSYGQFIAGISLAGDSL